VHHLNYLGTQQLHHRISCQGPLLLARACCGSSHDQSIHHLIGPLLQSHGNAGSVNWTTIIRQATYFLKIWFNLFNLWYCERPAKMVQTSFFHCYHRSPGYLRKKWLVDPQQVASVWQWFARAEPPESKSYLVSYRQWLPIWTSEVWLPCPQVSLHKGADVVGCLSWCFEKRFKFLWFKKRT